LRPAHATDPLGQWPQVIRDVSLRAGEQVCDQLGEHAASAAAIAAKPPRCVTAPAALVYRDPAASQADWFLGGIEAGGRAVAPAVIAHALE
jgi:hypothetical protein